LKNNSVNDLLLVTGVVVMRILISLFLGVSIFFLLSEEALSGPMDCRARMADCFEYCIGEFPEEEGCGIEVMFDCVNMCLEHACEGFPPGQNSSNRRPIGFGYATAPCFLTYCGTWRLGLCFELEKEEPCGVEIWCGPYG
jgi:hypothetical protein